MTEETIIKHLEKYGNCFLGKKTISKSNIEKIISRLCEKSFDCTYKQALNFPKYFVIERTVAINATK